MHCFSKYYTVVGIIGLTLCVTTNTAAADESCGWDMTDPYGRFMETLCLVSLAPLAEGFFAVAEKLAEKVTFEPQGSSVEGASQEKVELEQKAAVDEAAEEVGVLIMVGEHWGGSSGEPVAAKLQSPFPSPFATEPGLFVVRGIDVP